MHNEENSFSWDLYFFSNILAGIASFVIGSYLQMYFPIYFGALFMGYIVFFRIFREGEDMKKIMTYFAINVYIVFYVKLVLSLNLDIANVLFILSALTLISGMLLKQKLILGVYLIPVLYLFFLYVNRRVFLVSLFSIKQQFLSVYVIDQIVVIAIILFLLVLELRSFRLVFASSSNYIDPYERIMRLRIGKKVLK